MGLGETVPLQHRLWKRDMLLLGDVCMETKNKACYMKYDIFSYPFGA